MNDESKKYKCYLDLCNSEEYQLLQQFYHKKTLFDILGVARLENPHSSFISWMLNPFESHGMGDFPMKRFLETLCFAYMKYGQDYLTEDNTTFVHYDAASGKQQTVRDKLLFFHGSTEQEEKTNLRKKVMQGDYRITLCKIERERVLTAQRRADIYIELSLQIAEKPYRVLLFIENKVKSGENDNQTDAYMDYLLKESDNESKESDKVVFIVPIVLTPATNSELVSYAESLSGKQAKKLPCRNRLFLILNYQYLMDGVLAPCRTAFKGERIYDILTDYVSCLGKSIDDAKNTMAELPISIMAVSREEKEWSSRLWEKHQDTLLSICHELCGEAEEPLIAWNPSNVQFYRTILSVILLQEKELGLEQNASYIREALKIRYFVKQNNNKILHFVSGKSGNRESGTLGALAYVILRQYILLHMDESADDIRKKLRKQINHSWLCNFFITKKELEQLSEAWLNQYLEKETLPVCKWRQKESKGWSGCPLEMFGAKNRNKADEQFLQQNDCPLKLKSSNKELLDWYYTQNPNKTCACLYEVVHCFFVKDLEDTIKAQPWGKNGVNASLIFNEKSFQNGNFSKAFGAIRVNGWVEDFVFVARFWGAETLESLLDALGMWGYVGKGTAEIQNRLDFTIADL